MLPSSPIFGPPTVECPDRSPQNSLSVPDEKSTSWMRWLRSSCTASLAFEKREKKPEFTFG
jgi:hypothetical protein